MDRRLLALCFGNFVIGTGTLIVPGMLSVLAARNVDRLGAPRLVALSILAMLAGHVLWLFAPGSSVVLSGSLLLWGWTASPATACSGSG